MNSEMENAYFKKWRDAANILAKAPSEKVICPECGIGDLKVRDEIVDSLKKLDRYMICNHCGKFNVMTMNFPEDYST
jgi:uncharacterized Zn finger protein